VYYVKSLRVKHSLITASVSLVPVYCLNVAMIQQLSLQIHRQASSSCLHQAGHIQAHYFSLPQGVVFSREWMMFLTFILSRASLSLSSRICLSQVSLKQWTLRTYLNGMDASWALGTSPLWLRSLASWGLHLRSWSASFEHQRWCLACIIFSMCRGHRKRTLSQATC